MKKINLNLCLKITLALLIAYQSYKVYKIGKELDYLEKTGQMKCSKP
jgi:hypothetical protein